MPTFGAGPVQRLFVAAAVAGAANADAPRVLNSRTIVLAVDSEPNTALELHVSTDERRTWKRAACETLSPGAVTYRATSDGRHDFYFVARATSGAASPAPTPGCAAHSQVVVDTLPPVLQIREVLTSTSGADAGYAPRRLRIRATVVDQNPAPGGVRLFYRSAASEPWIDGGMHAVQGGEVDWSAPPELGDVIDLHVVARDLAGNTSGVELLAVPLRTLEPPRQGHDIAGAIRLANDETHAPADASPLKPRPGARDWNETTPTSAPAQRPAQARDPATVALREQAARFMAEGRYALAAARLEAALRQSPDDADALLDLADARFWLGDYDAASGLFGRAHQANPQAIRPLEGLALLAATQQRFGEARERLEALVKLDPASAEFRIRLGDMRLRGGDERGARELWQAIVGEATQPPAIRDKAQRRLSRLVR